MIDVTVTPSLFEEFYAAIAGHGPEGGAGTIVTLIRTDGQLLVRYPAIAWHPAGRRPNDPLHAGGRGPSGWRHV